LILFLIQNVSGHKDGLQKAFFFGGPCCSSALHCEDDFLGMFK
jgi:hypothetical protein